jgi:uncharacterized LabA/DUF88 family protein
MVLNIFPRREKPASAPVIEERTLPEPSPEAFEEPARKQTRRGTRGGRGRRKPTDAATEATPETTAEEEPVKAAPRRSRAARTEEPVEPTAEELPKEPAAPKRGARKPAEGAAAAAPAARKPAAKVSGDGAGDLAALVRVVEAQGKQLEQLARSQEELLKRGPAGGPIAPPARVGIFVDAANVELAIDRLRTRIDWRKVLNLLTENRTLVRAMAYSPVHDDPGVSIETQRFAEPFLGKGYKVVTKPLKRFADGTIKANVDIEMACDIIEMLDRLDVVCLVSGDGDFQRLVEVIQAKGVRVEVVAVGSSTAANLRNAADQFIDLQGIVQKVKA